MHAPLLFRNETAYNERSNFVTVANLTGNGVLDMPDTVMAPPARGAPQQQPSPADLEQPHDG